MACAAGRAGFVEGPRDGVFPALASARFTAHDLPIRSGGFGARSGNPLDHKYKQKIAS